MRQYYDHKIMEGSRLWLSFVIGWNGLALLVGALVFCSAQWSTLYYGAAVWLAVNIGIWVTRPEPFYTGTEFTGPIINNWRVAMTKIDLVRRDAKGQITAYPTLYEITGNKASWSAKVNLQIFLPNEVADRLAIIQDYMNMGFLRFSVEPAANGSVVEMIRCTPQYMPVICNAELITIPARPRRRTAVEIMRGIPVAQVSSGAWYELPLLDGHVLLAGITRSGKSGWLWSVIMGLVQPVAEGYVKLWGLDGKGVELAICREWFSEYATESEDMVLLLEQAIAAMKVRKGQLAGKARKFTPSPETPLNLICIDELAYITLFLPTEKPKNGVSLQTRADRAIMELLTQGAGLGFVLFGCVQDPRKETVPSRDLWVTKIGLKLEAGMVNLLYGPQARDEGVMCHLIPSESKGGAGNAFVRIDGSYQVARAPWYDDQQIQQSWHMVESYRANEAAARLAASDESETVDNISYLPQTLKADSA